MTRPEYVKCSLTGYYSRPEPNPELELKTWCGREPEAFEFTFQNASHAVQNAHRRGRLLICPDCAAAMIAAIQGGTWEPDEGKERTR